MKSIYCTHLTESCEEFSLIIITTIQFLCELITYLLMSRGVNWTSRHLYHDALPTLKKHSYKGICKERSLQIITDQQNNRPGIDITDIPWLRVAL